MFLSRLRGALSSTESTDDAAIELQLPDTSARARLHLERVEGVSAIGWAVSADMQPATVELLVDGQVVAASVVAVHRQDVIDAMKMGGEPRLGFRVDLPPEVWREGGDGARSLQLRVADQVCPVPLSTTLIEWVRSTREAGEGGVQTSHLLRLLRHVAFLGGTRHLPSDLGEWLLAVADERGLSEAWVDPLWEPPSPGAVRGAVERLEGPVVHGWAWVDGGTHEPITLSCDGHRLDCSIIRVERDDVRQALGVDRARLGFEIEVPVAVWKHASGAEARLIVRVAGIQIHVEPLVLRHEALVQSFGQIHSNEVAARPDESTAAGHEGQYLSLLLLEHLAATDLLLALPAQLRFFARALAGRFGVHSLFAQVDTTSSLDGSDEDIAPQDHGTVTVWRMQHAFNSRLGEARSDPTSVLGAVLLEAGIRGETEQRFLWSLIPFFCAQGCYETLRPRLDLVRLRRFSVSESAWELTLLLPEAVASADLRLATSLLKKLASGVGGWLNTECVAEAVRRLCARACNGVLEDAAEIQVFDAHLGLLEHLGLQGYWSRLHDAHLIASVIFALESVSALPSDMARRLCDGVVRHYALVPDFWRAVDRSDGPLGGWPEALRVARRQFEQVRRILTAAPHDSSETSANMPAALAALRSSGNRDADILARELLMRSIRGDGDDLAANLSRDGVTGSAAISADEPLRLLAFPGVDQEMQTPLPLELLDRIRALADVPPVSRRDLQVACMSECLHSATPGSSAGWSDERCAAAVRQLNHRDNHFLGLRLAVTRWVRRSKEQDPMGREASLAELRELWVQAFDGCVDQPHPPASLSAAFSQMSAAMTASPDNALGRLVAEMHACLRTRYGDFVCQALAPHGTPALQAGHAATSTLVVIYSCRRNLSTRVRAIRETWARDLTALGVPWLVLVGDGQGQIEGDVLGLPVPDSYEALPAKTLALVGWVYRNTDFEHLVKIDDDCHFAAKAFFEQSAHLAHHYHGRRLRRGVGDTDRNWHQGRASTERAASAMDKSPEPSTYADGGAGYSLSRYAMAQVIAALDTTAGARLTRSAYLEDKLLGDLLAQRGLALSDEGHYTLIRRRFGPKAVPVNAYDNLFYPGPLSPTLVTHLDGHEDLPEIHAGLSRSRLAPSRLWPTDAPPRLGGVGTNQLELLSSPQGAQALRGAAVIVVAVARNERVLMPHFLAHYRKLGVRHFVLVDNLSDDGTREYLLTQDDVVLYSADTQYRHSHYGVSWQQAVLGAHALGQWVVLADIDEFLVYPGMEQQSLPRWLSTVEQQGRDAVLTLMIDMYPSGALDTADFNLQAPFELAPHFDQSPLVRWRLGSGCFSNGPTYLSALRHRLIPDSAPNLYTSQKLAIFRYLPWVRLSEGLHYASNLLVAARPAWFAHFKYHAGFQRKVREEVARKQHFNGAEEYRKYVAMLAEASQTLVRDGVTGTYTGSQSWIEFDGEI